MTASIAAFLSHSTQPPRAKRITWLRSSIGDGLIEKLFTEVVAMIDSNDFSEFTPSHAVAMHAHLFSETYGVPTGDPPAFRGVVCRRAASLFEKEFEKDAEAFVKYILWVWSREEQREEWRRKNGRSGATIGAMWQFDQRLVTEYRIDQKRR